MLWLQSYKLLSSVLSDGGVLQRALMNPIDMEGGCIPSPGVEVLSVVHCITK